MSVVRDLVPDDEIVQGVLYCVGTEWGFAYRGFSTGGVAVLPPRRLLKAVTTDGAIPLADVDSMHLALSSRLRPA